MRLITFQDKIVIDTIEEKEKQGLTPLYFCNKIFFIEKEERIYNEVIRSMKSKLGIHDNQMAIPIWCWTIPKNVEITDELLDELYNRAVPKCDRLIALELEVPKEFVFITNFDVWYDLKFKCRFNEEITQEDIDKLYEKKKGARTQACIPFIDKKFIINSKDYEDYLHKDYTQTDEEIKSLQARGEFLKG